MTTMATRTRSFHSSYDAQVRSYQIYQPAKGWVAPITFGRFITIRERSVSYEFFPHFHPYVPDLMRRLVDGGIDTLQASDTLYLPQPNPADGKPPQPLHVLPGSTRAVLAAQTAATQADGTPVSLPAGVSVTLPDNTSVVVRAPNTVARLDGSTFKLPADMLPLQLPGNLPVSSSGGIQWTITGMPAIARDGTPIVVPDGTPAVLPSGAASAVLANDGSAINLPAGTGVVIRAGLPKPVYYADIFDDTHYNPDLTAVHHPFPVRNLDFTTDGAYSIYNWELFFHVPLLIAIHLSQNQKYQDAQRWFHYIFNPTDNSLGPTPARFWKVLPFQSTDVEMIQQILLNLASNQDPKLADQTVKSIDDWKDHPFQPFAVGRHRPTAYMLKTVMGYLDNLIAWGDSLFQQYTIETINEATQLYVLAANILGPRPQAVPPMGSVKPMTYKDLRARFEAAEKSSTDGSNADAFGDPLVEMEADIPFDLAPMPAPASNPAGTQILASIGQTLYFAVPRNDKLLGYWDTVADRLFNIHNSRTIQGVFQPLPLFDPPIDPALLVRAAAAGLDVSAVVSGLNQPLPLVRFELLVSKATEICQEVKSLGANILAAIEKQDNETLALMRAQHESAILGLAQAVKYGQLQDAIKARQGLEQSLANAAQRYTYYQKLLGRTDAQIQSAIPQLDALDIGGLQNLKFTQNDPSSEPQLAFDAISVDISQDATSVSDGEIKTLSGHEVQDLNLLSDAQIAHDIASGLSAVSAVVSPIPNVDVAGTPFGVGVKVAIGGIHLSQMVNALASVARGVADRLSYEAGRTSKIGSYSRRELDWLFQSNLAVGEMNLTLKQLRGAQIREAIAQREYDNHQTQMLQAQEIVDFLQGKETELVFQVKETTVGFYAWMKREVKALYAKAFQLAFEVAKKAERGMQYELGDPTLTYIHYNYLDGNEGLLAGEKLLFDVKTMEMAYHDLNQREYELTKHVSLLQVAPLALVQLRATGTCSVTLPEELFDLDGPGHYFRRIKSVALTIPCVTGPYTSIGCTLSLQKSTIRIGTDVAEGYARKGSDDARFNDYYGTVQTIVASSGQSDSGLFETNLRDERYLPFERAGIVDSQWQLSLPADVRQFDFDTITDVILHVRYTAREGGESLKAAAVKNLQTQIDKAQTVGSVRLFSVRHEFPTEWARFRSVTIGGATPTAALALALRPEHYPYWAQGLVGSGPVKAVELFAEMLPTDKATTVNFYDKADKTGHTDTLSQNPALGGLLAGSLVKIPLPAAVTDPTSPVTLYFDDNAMQDLWLAVTWGKV